MTSTTPDLRAAPLREPKPIIPPLASFYSRARELSWLVVRLTAGGMLLVHGIVKTMAVADKGMAAWAAGFAAGVTDYLTKPFRPAHVRARVQAWLLRRPAEAPHDT